MLFCSVESEVFCFNFNLSFSLLSFCISICALYARGYYSRGVLQSLPCCDGGFCLLYFCAGGGVCRLGAVRFFCASVCRATPCFYRVGMCLAVGVRGLYGDSSYVWG